MMFKQIESAALSLEEDAEDAGHDQIWAEEAAKRFRELRDNPTTGLPAEEVFRRLLARVPQKPGLPGRVGEDIVEAWFRMQCGLEER